MYYLLDANDDIYKSSKTPMAPESGYTAFEGEYKDTVQGIAEKVISDAKKVKKTSLLEQGINSNEEARVKMLNILLEERIAEGDASEPLQTIWDSYTWDMV